MLSLPGVQNLELWSQLCHFPSLHLLLLCNMRGLKRLDSLYVSLSYGVPLILDDVCNSRQPSVSCTVGLQKAQADRVLQESDSESGCLNH